MLARTDHDFVLEERRPRRAAKRARRLAVLRTLFKSPGRTIVGASAAAIGVAIIVNALALQGGPHPAPFFRPAHEAREPAKPLPPARPATLVQSQPQTSAQTSAQASAQAPAPVQAPAEADRTALAGSPAAVSGPASVPMPPRVQRTAAAPAAPVPQAASPGIPIPPANIPNVARDPIADMLKGSGNPAGGVTEAVRQEPVRKVLAAQRALNMLNYGPIKPDGLFGPGTRQAIERFERDRKLPVTGEVAGRTARELAAATGIAMD